MADPPISKLPPEALIEILKYTNTKDLAAVLATSKYLRTIVKTHAHAIVKPRLTVAYTNFQSEIAWLTDASAPNMIDVIARWKCKAHSINGANYPTLSVLVRDYLLHHFPLQHAQDVFPRKVVGRALIETCLCVLMPERGGVTELARMHLDMPECLRLIFPRGLPGQEESGRVQSITPEEIVAVYEEYKREYEDRKTAGRGRIGPLAVRQGETGNEEAQEVLGLPVLPKHFHYAFRTYRALIWYIRYSHRLEERPWIKAAIVEQICVC